MGVDDVTFEKTGAALGKSHSIRWPLTGVKGFSGL
jgi:hypothetical protein